MAAELLLWAAGLLGLLQLRAAAGQLGPLHGTASLCCNTSWGCLLGPARADVAEEESESIMDEEDLDRMAGAGSGPGATAREPTPETQLRVRSALCWCVLGWAGLVAFAFCV